MIGTGTIVNIILVIVGSLVGLLLKKAIPEKLKTSITQALGLAVITIGITGLITASVTVLKEGTLSSNHLLLMVISLATGTFIGELIDIEKKLNSFGDIMQNKFSSENKTFSEGFVTASLVFCVGSMAIIGSLNDGILHDPTILITKSILDGIMAMVFSSTLGIGVMFSAVTVGIYQGLITACASFISPLLTEQIISQMSFVGSILIMGIGLNFLYSPRLKLANMLPSIFIPIIWYIIKSFI